MKIEINCGNILRNAEKISAFTPLIAVVKADAYGHGAVAAAKTVERTAECIAVATENEAKTLLDAGVKKDVIVLHPCCAPALSAQNIVYSLVRAEDAPRFHGRRTAIKLNTGMNRFGADENDARDLISAASEQTHVHSVYSHLRDPSDDETTERQYENFAHMTAGLNVLKHIAASGALGREKKCPVGAARCGIALYGGLSGFAPAMSVKAEVLQVRSVPSGEGVGYGTAILQRPAYAAVIDVGYAHGYRRSGKTRRVFLGGKFRKVLAICMDCSIVEWDSRTCVGDVAELLGEHISPHELARSFGATVYEVFTSLGTGRTKGYI